MTALISIHLLVRRVGTGSMRPNATATDPTGLLRFFRPQPARLAQVLSVGESDRLPATKESAYRTTPDGAAARRSSPTRTVAAPPLTGITLRPDWRNASNDTRRMAVATPEPLDAQVEGELVEHIGLWRRAQDPTSPGGTAVIDVEEAAIRAHLLTKVAPKVTTLTTTMRLINSVSRGADGVYSARFQRTCRELWARRGDSNVIDLYPSLPLDVA